MSVYVISFSLHSFISMWVRCNQLSQVLGWWNSKSVRYKCNKIRFTFVLILNHVGVWFFFSSPVDLFAVSCVFRFSCSHVIYVFAVRLRMAALIIIDEYYMQTHQWHCQSIEFTGEFAKEAKKKQQTTEEHARVNVWTVYATIHTITYSLSLFLSFKYANTYHSNRKSDITWMIADLHIDIYTYMNGILTGLTHSISFSNLQNAFDVCHCCCWGASNVFDFVWLGLKSVVTFKVNVIRWRLRALWKVTLEISKLFTPLALWCGISWQTVPIVYTHKYTHHQNQRGKIKRKRISSGHSNFQIFTTVVLNWLLVSNFLLAHFFSFLWVSFLFVLSSSHSLVCHSMIDK